ncbi:hypothetical protein ACFY78_36575 [Streptomyces olindensis]|uniref:hypothetical protein n=1 Tax=Streptomyces olindensis TaxID=358823 RepID=UPI003679B4B6
MISKLAMLAKKTIEAAWLNGSSYDLATQAAEALEAKGMLRSLDSDAEGGSEASEFFHPGRTYTRDLPFRAPEDRPTFECVGIGVHPTKGSLRAFGFEQPGAGHPWVSAAQRMEEWADGWVEIGPAVPDRLTRTFAAVQALRQDNSEGAQPLIIYRASWDTMRLGRYTTQAEARKHCEDHARRDLPTTSFDWIEDEEDGVAELVATVDGTEGPTGYTVTALEIASKYNPEADE